MCIMEHWNRWRWVCFWCRCWADRVEQIQRQPLAEAIELSNCSVRFGIRIGRFRGNAIFPLKFLSSVCSFEFLFYVLLLAHSVHSKLEPVCRNWSNFMLSVRFFPSFYCIHVRKMQREEETTIRQVSAVCAMNNFLAILEAHWCLQWLRLREGGREGRERRRRSVMIFPE